MVQAEDVADRESRSRPLRRDAELNRRRIIDSARVLFSERGVAATLDDVARHAGVGVGTVYRRFPTKGALLEASFDLRLREVVALAEEAAESRRAWEALRYFLERCAELLAADRGLRDVALSVGAGSDNLDRIREDIVPMLGQLARRAHDEGGLRDGINANDLVLLLWMISQVAHQISEVAPGAYRRYVAIMIDGLRAGSNSTELTDPIPDSSLPALAQALNPLHRKVEN